MKKFIRYIPGQTDTQAQKKNQLKPVEKLIFKPHTEGINSLTEEEINQYLALDIEALKQENIDMKTIAICEETKKFILENKEALLEAIKQKSEKEEKKEKEKEKEEEERN